MENNNTFVHEQPANTGFGIYLWLAAGFAVAAMVIAAVVVFVFLTPTYRATASLQIEAQESSILNVDQVLGDTQERSVGYYATQYEILRSRDLAGQAVKNIDWNKYPDFLSDDQVSAGNGSEKTTEDRARVDKFMEQTRIQPVIPTLVVRVHFIAENPEMAKEAANALTAAYIASGYDAKSQAAERATDWISKRLGDLREQLQASETALQQFREKQDIVATQSGRDLQETELAANMEQLRQAKRAKTQLENTYSKVRQADGRLQALQEIPALIDRNPSVQKAKDAYLNAEQNYSDLDARYGPEHPKLAAARSALEQAERSYTNQLQNAADGIRAEYQIAAQNVKSLEQNVAQTRDENQQQGRQAYKLQQLKREVDTNQQLYDTLLQKFKATQTEGQFESLRARVIDPAVLPVQKYRPRRLRAIILAGVGGALLGLLLAGLLGRVDN